MHFALQRFKVNYTMTAMRNIYFTSSLIATSNQLFKIWSGYILHHTHACKFYVEHFLYTDNYKRDDNANVRQKVSGKGS
jgi:hypothetical protein